MKSISRLLVLTIAIIFAITVPANAENELAIQTLVKEIQEIAGYQPEYSIDSSTLTIYWPNATSICQNAIFKDNTRLQINTKTKCILLNQALDYKYDWYDDNCYVYWDGNDVFNLNEQDDLAFILDFYEKYKLISIIYEGSMILVDQASYIKENNGFMIPLEHFAQAVYNWERYLNIYTYSNTPAV